MRNTIVCAALWAATVAGAFVIGRGSTPEPKPGLLDADTAALEAENERLRGLLEECAPGLEGAGPRVRGHSGGEPGTAPGHPPMGSGEAIEDFDPNLVADPGEMLSMLRAYAREMFSRGREGHLQLLRTLDQLMKIEGLEDRFGRREEEQWRYLYPMVRFLVQNEKQVVDMMQTVYEEMASNPKAFEGLDNDAIEIFADEGIGPILPAVVDRERLEHFRTLAKKILATPESEQSEAIRRSRNEIERALALWWPEVTPDEAFERLQSGAAKPTEVLGYLRKLDGDQLAALDLGALLGPPIEAGDRSAVDLLKTIPVDDRTVAELDDAVIRGAMAGKVQGWMTAQYLAGTGRRAWADARAFVERGLGVGTNTTAVFADSIRFMRERPDRDWVVWMLQAYTLEDAQAARIRRHFGID